MRMDTREALGQIHRLGNLIVDLAKIEEKSDRKRELKKRLKKDKELVQWVFFTLDPFRPVRLTLEQVMEAAPEASIPNNLMDVLQNLWSPYGQELVAVKLRTCTKEMSSFGKHGLQALLAKSLRCGLGITSVNEVLQELGECPIDVFNPAKAVAYKKESWKDYQMDSYASECLVGQRCLVHLPVGDPQFFTPTGRPIECCDSLIDAFYNWPGGGDFILDGKLALDTPQGEEDFFLIEEAVRNRSKEQFKRVVFIAFDMIPLNDFLRGESNIRYVNRLSKMWGHISTMKQENVRMLPQRLVTSEMLESGDWRSKELLQTARSQKWQGIVFRRDEPYCGGVTRNIQVMDLE